MTPNKSMNVANDAEEPEVKLGQLGMSRELSESNEIRNKLKHEIVKVINLQRARQRAYSFMEVVGDATP